jgi:hypothetical protein
VSAGPVYGALAQVVFLVIRVLAVVTGRASPVPEVDHWNVRVGVLHAAASGSRPVVDAGGLWGFLPEERADPEGRWPMAVPQQVTPGYFSAIGTPLLAGRDSVGASVLPAMRAARISPVEALRGTAS